MNKKERIVIAMAFKPYCKKFKCEVKSCPLYDLTPKCEFKEECLINLISDC